MSIVPELTICMAVSMNDTPTCDGPRSTLSPERNVTPFPASPDFTRLLRLHRNTPVGSNCLQPSFQFSFGNQRRELRYLGSLGMEGMKDPVRL